ncbi:Hypothetical protein NTJ_06006 [Nesidiocoris tenuis]|uniref:Uncharacterized protein n=1 Tax=Nesidiocoris tenuis TaxID=355587 RepID=A0ABN7APH2_9HEMI|nr:Hypothetical protein NTJ_06006 [Nesidiocoris tenuis]
MELEKIAKLELTSDCGQTKPFRVICVVKLHNSLPFRLSASLALAPEFQALVRAARFNPYDPIVFEIRRVEGMNTSRFAIAVAFAA